MRLFLVALLVVAVSASGCRKEEAPPSAGALRVLISYATFRPACLTLGVVDREDPSRTDSAEVRVEPGVRSDTRRVAVLGRPGWSREVRLTATAHERSCNGPVVAEQTVEAQVPRVGSEDVRLDLRAEDLDDDGFITAQAARPGTDCDDSRRDVNPLADDICDGVDNNCSGNESDAPGAGPFYPDVDGDGYGNGQATPSLTCIQPAGTTPQAGDCNDTDATIHPGQEEQRCDGVDEDCDGARDNDSFAVGSPCTTALGCIGARVCQGVSAATCVSAQEPVAWYVDEDGDGTAGADAGPGCTAPVPGASEQRTDCDESSRFAATGATEVCDRLDNDCDGQADEDLAGCGAVAWNAETAVAADVTWNAVATYARNRGWLAGDAGRLVHVDGATLTAVDLCDGDWESAWAAANGRVFLGSSTGELATHLPGTPGPCEKVAGPGSSSINGLVGFEQGGTVSLFAVDSAGRILRWSYAESGGSQGAPQAVTQVAANLKALHGLSPETLLAVGAETVDGQQRPVAWHAPASGSTWRKESLGNTGTAEFLRGVQVLTPRLAYAAGDDGLLLERSGGTWTAKPGLTLAGGTTPDLRALRAFGSTVLYAVSSDVRDLHRFDGTAWSTATVPPATLNALGGTQPDDVWGAGGGGTLVRWQP